VLVMVNAIKFEKSDKCHRVHVPWTGDKFSCWSSVLICSMPLLLLNGDVSQNYLISLKLAN